MNSGNYGNAFVDASEKTVQPTGWGKKGGKKKDFFQIFYPNAKNLFLTAKYYIFGSF